MPMTRGLKIIFEVSKMGVRLLRHTRWASSTDTGLTRRCVFNECVDGTRDRCLGRIARPRLLLLMLLSAAFLAMVIHDHHCGHSHTMPMVGGLKILLEISKMSMRRLASTRRTHGGRLAWC